MSTWSESCVGYKLGTVGILLSFLAFALSFSTPAWYDNGGGTQFGLWHWCNAEWTCIFLDARVFNSPTSYWVFRGLEIAALVCFFIAALNVVLKICCCPHSGPGRIVAPACIGAFLGLAAAILSITWVVSFYFIKNYLSWSFGVSVGACVLGILCAVLVACTGTSPGGTPGQLLNSSPPEQNTPGFGKPYQPYQQPEVQPYHPYQQSDAFANQQHNNHPQKY